MGVAKDMRAILRRHQVGQSADVLAAEVRVVIVAELSTRRAPGAETSRWWSELITGVAQCGGGAGEAETCGGLARVDWIGGMGTGCGVPHIFGCESRALDARIDGGTEPRVL
jgi:hypothetical protein